jgi:hypothetical protein
MVDTAIVRGGGCESRGHDQEDGGGNQRGFEDAL